MEDLHMAFGVAATVPVIQKRRRERDVIITPARAVEVGQCGHCGICRRF